MKAVIFDMDGVIVDSEAFHIKIKMQTLQEYGIEAQAKDCVPYAGRSSKAFFTDFVKKSKKNIAIEEIVARKHTLTTEYIQSGKEIKPVAGAIELIKELYAHKIPLALASSSVRTNIETFLKKFGVYECFSVVLSGAELPESKPNPAIYLQAAEKLGFKPEDCAVIEDAHAGVVAAKRAGNYCIAFNNPFYENCMADLSAADMMVDSLLELSAEQIKQL
ncbi:HAD superfamily hydrolase (TIGR01509 family) [Pectinatus brassicae]|uniref:HAD superfamily hydrolase (TIGR01509 family) n=2 Tax=Pectinatus brassicae TaxID=862415 RepID=A0A840UKE9_9FIRM|nr:HAD family phosphatase [Pectinatus brassicae]MBB5336137.1 HAD superfamily hydrolase (TIGR01509 family) [Pectinatus brassicae]